MSRTIAVGTGISVGLVALGVLLALAGGSTPEIAAGDEGLLEQIAAQEPASIIAVGLLLLALTPVAQLAVAAAAFAKCGERHYVLVTAGVLAALAVGIAAATLVSESVGG